MLGGPVDDADFKKEVKPTDGTKGYHQNHRRTARLDSRNRLRRIEQFTRRAIHPTAYEETHHRSSESSELPAEFLCADFAIEKNLYDRSHRGRDRRCVWRDGHQRDRGILKKEQLLLSHGDSSARSETFSNVRANAFDARSGGLHYDRHVADGESDPPDRSRRGTHARRRRYQYRAAALTRRTICARASYGLCAPRH